MAVPRHHSIGKAPQLTTNPRVIGWMETVRRAGRVIRFDSTVYDEIAREPSAVRQAGRIVGFVTAAAALGTVLINGWEFGTIAGAALAAVVHWLLWTELIVLIAVSIFHSTTSLPRLLAAMGYAQAPQVLVIFGFIPVVGPAVVVVSRLLSAVAGAQAMRNTSDLDRRQRLATSILAFVISFALTTLLKASLGDIGNWQALIRP